MTTEMELSLKEIAELVGGEVRGDGSALVHGVSSLEGGAAGLISFFGNPKKREAALNSQAGALIVSEPLDSATPQIVVDYDPYAAFVKVMAHFHPARKAAPGVHPTSVVDKSATIGEGASVGPLAVIGAGVKVGASAVVGAGAVIGEGCEIGSDAVIHARVTLYARVKVGARTIIHSGAVIGADGFGFILTGEGHVKKPQVGVVIIGDDVEIGANCAIDRAMLDATVVGSGTKLDNLVHLAHNVRVGEHCIILAGTAVGGSATIGDRAIVSGACTVKDGVTIGAGAMIVGTSGVADDVPPGEVYWGMPAMPFSQAKRVYSRLKQLPELFRRLRALEKKAGKDE